MRHASEFSKPFEMLLITMRLVVGASCLFFLIGFAGCNRNRINTQSPLIGQYALVGYDTSGRLAFTGTISLNSVEQSLLKGQCAITKEKSAPTGLLDEGGGCEGQLNGNKVSFDFAPYLDDAGLLLEGEIDGSRITGVWMLDGFATSAPMGKFEAVKKGG